MPRKTVEEVAKELDEHWSKEKAATDPFSLKVVSFNHYTPGGMALIKLPYRSNTVEFGIAVRSIKKVADEARVICLFFDADQVYESMNGDNDLALARFGLMRRKA